METDERFCPLCSRDIPEVLCFEIIMGLQGMLKMSAIPEVTIERSDETKRICGECPYSDID